MPKHGGFRGAHATIQCHHARTSSRTREQALQAAFAIWAGVDSGLLEIAACRAFLTRVFHPKLALQLKNPAAQKIAGRYLSFQGGDF